MNLQLDHIPVLLSEMLTSLNPKAGEEILDCTFGAGGYSKAILATGAKVTALDRDESVEKYADILKKEFKQDFTFINAKFSEINKHFTHNKMFDGIVLDLGVSSMQLDQAERGFSFMHDGILDMRMGKNGKSAQDFVNNASETDIADVIFKYGDETASRKIAKFIINARKLNPITTTLELAEIVRKAIGHRPGKIDPATKTFQAIRIWVNDEMQEIEAFFENVDSILAIGGRIVVVTFHSLEDKIVKDYLSNHSAKKVAISKYAHLSPNYKQSETNQYIYEILNKKPITPSKAEIMRNPRSRSAKLRSAIKISERAYE